jgi:hypothetical protein
MSAYAGAIARKVTEARDLKIGARARRVEHGVVVGAWTRATIADVTQSRFSAVPDSFISRFWNLAGGSIDAEFLPSQRHVTRKVGRETLVVQKAVSGMGTSHMLSWTQAFWTGTAKMDHRSSSWTVSGI